MTCPVAKDTAEHCNPDEIMCPECHENMYLDEYDNTTLVCSSSFCPYEMNAEEE